MSDESDIQIVHSHNGHTQSGDSKETNKTTFSIVQSLEKTQWLFSQLGKDDATFSVTTWRG